MIDMQTQGAGSYGQNMSLASLFQWAVALFKSPRDFFRGMAKGGGYGGPFLYALAWFFLATVVQLIVSIVHPQGMDVGWAARAVWLFLGPVFLVLFGFIGAAVLFVIWHLMGSKENYQTAFRCWAYTTPISLISAILGIVPYLNLLAFAYAIFLLVAASTETHKISAGRAWTVWGIIGGVLLALTAVSIPLRNALERQGLLNTPGFSAGGNQDLPDFGDLGDEEDFEEPVASTAAAPGAR